MNVLFVCQTHESLGLEYLSAVLRQHGHVTKLAFDPALFEHPQLRSRPLSRLLSYRSLLLNDAARFEPDLVAINVWTHNAPWAVDIARDLKQATGAPVVVGGVHVSGAPEHTMRHPEYDFGIVGEGEGPLLALVKALEGDADLSTVPNLMYRQDGQLIRNPLGPFPDYAALPWPDKELFLRESKHFGHGYYIQTSRGCPMRCSFCTEDFLSGLSDTGRRNHKAYLRTRPVDDVIAELVENRARYGFTHVLFSDDILGWDQDWFEHFAHEYKRRVDLPYWCFTYPSVVSERMLRNMVMSGCYQVQMGVQSLSPNVRKDIMLRQESREQITRAIELFRRSPISLKVDNIAGVPGQTNDDLIDMARYYSVHRPDGLGIYWLTYYPGTSIISIAEQMGRLGKDDIERINDSSEGITCYEPSAEHEPIDAGLFGYVSWVIFLPDWVNRVIIRHRYYHFWPTHHWSLAFLLFIQLFVKKPIPFWNAEARLVRKTVDYLGRIVKGRIITPLRARFRRARRDGQNGLRGSRRAFAG
jgi:anaerobic magnesium-protoporphyrin IX monomethyl ester cyclase